MQRAGGASPTCLSQPKYLEPTNSMSNETPRLFTPRLLVMCGFYFMMCLLYFQLLSTVPFRIRDLGGTTFAAGLFLGFLTYASASSAPITGAIADRIGRRRTLSLPAASSVSALPATACSPTTASCSWSSSFTGSSGRRCSRRRPRMSRTWCRRVAAPRVSHIGVFRPFPPWRSVRRLPFGSMSAAGYGFACRAVRSTWRWQSPRGRCRIFLRGSAMSTPRPGSPAGGCSC